MLILPLFSILTQVVLASCVMGLAPRQAEAGTFSVTVTQEISETESSLGLITEECLIVLDSPSTQGVPEGEGMVGGRFCRVIVGDVELPAMSAGTVPLTSASALVLPSSSSDTVVGTSTSPSASASEALFAPTNDSLRSSESTSASTTDSSSAVANASPTPTPSLSGIVTLSPESASSTDTPNSASETPAAPDTAPVAESLITAPTSASTSIGEPSSSSTLGSDQPESSSSTSTDPLVSIATSDPVSESDVSPPSASLLNPLDPITSTRPAAPSSPTSEASTVSGSGVVDVSATVAAAEADSQAQEVPGQKMQVLPIGLGVVGGLAGITLAVVGYVMYERHKYRGQFRSRRVAEMGQAAWVR